MSRPQEEYKKVFIPSVNDIVSDKLTLLGLEYWADEQRKPYEAKVIEDIYDEIYRNEKSFSLTRVMLLELSHYLEYYLWPNFSDQSSFAHVMSMIVMVNEKFRENVAGSWSCFHSDEKKFHAFFDRVLKLREEQQLSMAEETYYIMFLINCFQSLEDEMVRDEVLRLVSLPLWLEVNHHRAEEEIENLSSKLQKRWKRLRRKRDSIKGPERSFLSGLIHFFLNIVEELSTSNKGELEKDKVRYAERFIEFMIDLMNQLPTRRFFHLLLDDSHLIPRCRVSAFIKMQDASLFRQLLDGLRYYFDFEVNNYTGEPFSDEEMSASHCKRIQALQKGVFRLFPEKLRSFALSNIGAVESRRELHKHLSSLSTSELRLLCEELHLLGPDEEKKDDMEADEQAEKQKEFLLEVLISMCERRLSHFDAINDMPLYPTEEILWDENLVPSITYTGEGCLALPKLNLQFLTFNDYLLRNFNLFRLEATYEIRQDIEDVIKRVNPRRALNGSTTFTGWARMALPIRNFKVTKVKPPRIGEKKPALVEAEMVIKLTNLTGRIREEWEDLKQHDIVYVLTVKSPVGPEEEFDVEQPFAERYGITYCRGCEVLQVFDEKGEDFHPAVPRPKHERPSGYGDVRTFRLKLDSAQFQQDMERKEKGAEDVYSTVNLVMRRKPKENNFKAILETIHSLMNSSCVVPDWLHDVFLGYGDPSAPNTKRRLYDVDFNDTFLSLDHLRECFFEYDIKVQGDVPPSSPFKVKIPQGEDDKTLVVQPYTPPNRGPYPYDIPKKNAIPFTKVQASAIRSAMDCGLTLVVGPPGTGKTDVAVQIISNWYHNFPEQRTLLVTHSNQALNQLFEKIMALDIDERHLIRLGHGYSTLETEKDFGKYGRVDYMLARRLENLKVVGKLAESVGAKGDFSWSCEAASHLYNLHIRPPWKNYKEKCKSEQSAECVEKNFPFTSFFSDVMPLFTGESFESDMEKARGCFRHIKKIFTELEECRPLELLRSGADRANYLLIKQARIIAMTCTHAALKRSELVSLGFKFDNLLMEEAAQILEIETFIPMLLQEQTPEKECPLKRVVLIGDHNQLPPVVKNMAFQRYAHMDQSLFTRFVRLGVPTITLDAQGRSRSGLASLYNWRYKELGNLPCVLDTPAYGSANAGFKFDYQLIDVGDHQGKGETEPNPYFYQNLAEAEYVVAVFMYMRLLGYPASKISILTSYNGQKHLIRDVVQQRCASHPLFGSPHKISTVDRFQGQQNDYILLSLVRTKAVGHIRDIRRLVVAMSRARLGLYVFCRKSLFLTCYELTPAFEKLIARPDTLQLVPSEAWPSERKLDAEVSNAVSVENLYHMQQLVAGQIQVAMQQYMLKMKEVTQLAITSSGQEEAMEEEREEGGEAIPPKKRARTEGEENGAATDNIKKEEEEEKEKEKETQEEAAETEGDNKKRKRKGK